MKYLLLLVVVGVGLWMLLRPRRRTGTPPRVDRAVEMVACAHCGVHLPRDDSVADGGRRYCSEAHRALGPR